MSFDELIQSCQITNEDVIQIRDNLDYVLEVLESRSEYFRYQYNDNARACAYDSAMMMVLYAVTNQVDQLRQYEKYDVDIENWA